MKLVVVNEVNIQNCQIQKATQSAVRLIFRAEDESIDDHVTVIFETEVSYCHCNSVTEHGAKMKGMDLENSEGGLAARMHIT
jgi:fructose-1,6-bisphosphatase/sedoheptulose 1,7-bisphosphatase-like protein